MAAAAEAVAYCNLRDSRKLAYREYGSSEGFPVLFFHGNLNSRLFEPAWEKTQAQTEAAGARVIAVDRPGYGLSGFLPSRTYGSWAQDVRELVQHLRLSAYAVLGFSSGGPNAMVCAAAACGGVAEVAAGEVEEGSLVLGGKVRIRATGRAGKLALIDHAHEEPFWVSFDDGLQPRAAWFEKSGVEVPQEGAVPRLAACGLISPDGPYTVIGGTHLQDIGIEGPTTTESVEPVIARSATRLREGYEGMKKEERRATAFVDLAEATRQGIGAAVQDGVLEGTDWGFSVASIRTAELPTLLWHGGSDPDVPVDVGRWVCEAIEGCRGTFIEGENHTLLRRHWQSILEQLVSAAQGGYGLPPPQ